MTESAPTNCSECGDEFTKRHVVQVTCSAKCKAARDIRMERERYEAAKVAAGGRPKKVCARCSQEKELHPSYWPFSRGAAIGAFCLPCWRARKRDVYDPRAQAKEAEKTRLSEELQKKIQKARKKAERAAQEAAQSSGSEDQRAIRAGVAGLNKMAPGVLAEMVEHLKDPNSPKHGETLEFLASRMLPLSFFGDVAESMAHDDGDNETPHVIQVRQSDGPDDSQLEEGSPE
jgi:hypothetical protein